ncbi:DUF775-domain-containing protein [Dacryopinax primogenitus]|uniref:DUF775-domain-containing protein n=1 Tax=Dacryopinax primogenitus (strain DJM 731) TaxID=1858805 RepID=M5G0M6_DACPD|nr:DUF775-domain-containing protein [Dacryopinax primogenitus]EJU01675.1 DUF775-domain-containing protein [Dacryopinax primogenitus]
MFGCCVAGRLVQTDLVQMDSTHSVFNIPSASTVNHVCVFLTGQTPFPDGWGATVHWNWPGRGFQLLGMLSNQKPSAIFRLRGILPGQSSATDTDMGMDDETGVSATSNSSAGDMAQIGLSIEPLDQVQQQVASLSNVSTSKSLVPVRPQMPPQAQTASDPVYLTELILKNLSNYLTSFTHDNTLNPTNTVQIGIIQKWYENLMNKLRLRGTAFLERQD